MASRQPAREAGRSVRTGVPAVPDVGEENFRMLVDSVRDYAIVLLHPTGTVASWNGGAQRIKGYAAHEIVGKHMSVFYTPEEVEAGKPARLLNQAAEEGRIEDEGWRVRKDGSRFWADVVLTAIRGDDGELRGFAKVTRDLTERRRMEEDLRRSRDELEKRVEERTAELLRSTEAEKRLAREILELSTPVVQAWDGVILAPLIGTLDSQRTQQVMERLLQGIVAANAPIALIDITGVPTIDTSTARHLIETISAVRLLGADVILTGVRPAIAQTLVHLGIDLSGVTTRASLVAGMRLALDMAGLQVQPKT